MAYFDFDFKDVDKQKLQNLLPSLLIQLSARSHTRCGVLSQLYSSHDRKIRKPDDRIMIKCLEEMLALDMQGLTYNIMDIIDEYPLISGVAFPQEVPELIEELMGLHLLDVHICATSRPELDIQAILEPLTPYPVSYLLTTKLGKSKISQIISGLLFTETEGCEDGGMRTRT